MAQWIKTEFGSIALLSNHDPFPKTDQALIEPNGLIAISKTLEAKKIIDLPDWNVDATWAGYYLQGTHTEVYTRQVDDVIHIINGIGGKGMTTSPGFTSEYIQKLYQK